MPIFWLVKLTMGGGRSATSSPLQSLWIEIAASCPCATAQMMFFGPNAASPPRNTPGRVDCMVLGSTFGMPRRSNSRPTSRSIQGNAFSWPTATSTSSQGKCWSGKRVLLADRDQHIVAGKMLVRLAARHQVAPALWVVLGLHLLEQHPGQAAVLVGEFLGHEKIV